MALSDGLISQVYPLSGESSIVDYLTSDLFSGTGTPALIDGDGGVKCWSIPANSDLRAAFSGIDTSSGDFQFSVAARIKLTSSGTDSFASLCGLTSSSGVIVNDSASITRSGTTYRSKYSTTSAPGFSAITAINNLHTIVINFVGTNVNATDVMHVWVGGVSRTDNAANYASNAANWPTKNFNQLFLTGTSGAAFQLYDMAIWNRALTDAEASSVADNYRSVMPSPAVGPVTVTSAVAAGMPKPSAASTVNVQSTTISFTVSAGLPAPSASSAVTIVPAVGDPIFTSEPLYNNTNGATGLLANTLLDYVAIYSSTSPRNLILESANVTTDSNGRFSVQSSLLTSGVSYKVDWQVNSTGVSRMPVKAAV